MICGSASQKISLHCEKWILGRGTKIERAHGEWDACCKLRETITLLVVTEGRSWEGRAGDISWVAAIGGGKGGGGGGWSSHAVFHREWVSLCVVPLSGELLRTVCFTEGWQQRDRAALLLSQRLCLSVFSSGQLQGVTGYRPLDLSSWSCLSSYGCESYSEGLLRANVVISATLNQKKRRSLELIL